MLLSLSQMPPPLSDVVQGTRTRHHNHMTKRCVPCSIWENPGFREMLSCFVGALAGTFDLYLIVVHTLFAAVDIQSTRESSALIKNQQNGQLWRYLPVSFRSPFPSISSLPHPLFTLSCSLPFPLTPSTHTHTHTHTHTLKHIKGLLPVWVLEQLQKLLNEPLASLTINLPLGRTRYSLRPTLNGL